MGRKHSPNAIDSPGLLATLVLYAPLVVSAYFLAVIFESPGHPFVGLLAFIPLLRAAQVLRPRSALLAGGLWGAALLGFSGLRVEALFADTWTAWLLVILTPALYCAGGAWITRRVGFSPFLLGVGWILVECTLQPLVHHHGLVAGSQSTGLLAVIGGVFGYAWVAFLMVFAGAWLLRIVSRVRLALLLSPPTLGLDAAGRWLWDLNPSCAPCLAPCRSHPRAPPRRG